jgi:hypothetical protein
VDYGGYASRWLIERREVYKIGLLLSLGLCDLIFMVASSDVEVRLSCGHDVVFVLINIEFALGRDGD